MTSTSTDLNDHDILALVTGIINEDSEVSSYDNDLVKRAFDQTNCGRYRFEALGHILASIGFFFETAPFDDEAVQVMAENRARAWSHLMLDQLVAAKIPR